MATVKIPYTPTLIPFKEEEPGPFVGEQFWSLYNQYILGTFNEGVLNASLSFQVQKHPNIHLLARTGSQRSKILGWIALKNQDILDAEGNLLLQIVTGDVALVSGNDCVIVTHYPKVKVSQRELVQNERIKGLFLPIFDPSPLEKATIIALEHHSKSNLEYAQAVRATWGQI